MSKNVFKKNWFQLKGDKLCVHVKFCVPKSDIADIKILYVKLLKIHGF